MRKSMTKIIQPSEVSGWGLVIRAIKAGQPVGMPTETVYGLAANALDGEVAARIYAVKERPADNPLICHISSLAMLPKLVRVRSSDGELDIPERLRPVMEAFWPGPLTLLLPRAAWLPTVVTGGQETVAVRMPNHPVALRLIEEAGVPLAAPSANLSGRPSPTCSAHVLADLAGRIDFIVEGGACELGLESTVLDALRDPPLILRPGAITRAMLEPYLPGVQHYSQQQLAEMLERPPTPGLKYRHYSPTAPVALFQEAAGISVWLAAQPADRKFVWIHPRMEASLANKLPPSLANVQHLYLSRGGCLREMAHNLFGALREADSFNPDWIIAEVIDDGGDDEGLAIMNRLGKAATLRL